jgi:hypothetical protein
MKKDALTQDTVKKEKRQDSIRPCLNEHDVFPPVPYTLKSKGLSALNVHNDLTLLQSVLPPMATYIHNLSSIDELLERDKQREKDGFPRKIRIGRLIKPGRGGKAKIILVPTTVEEKLIHDTRVGSPETGEGSASGGSGEGQEMVPGLVGPGKVKVQTMKSNPMPMIWGAF